jgi:hypothetical protein
VVVVSEEGTGVEVDVDVSVLGGRSPPCESSPQAVKARIHTAIRAKSFDFMNIPSEAVNLFEGKGQIKESPLFYP